MVSEVPCVATDVGDNDFIIGDTGIITPIGDDQAMADAWKTMVEMDKEEFASLGKAARQRCLENFTLEQQVKQHEDLYQTLHDHNIMGKASMNEAST